MIDIGLNIKNLKKGVHIPDYVRYTAEPVEYSIDNYNHSGFAHKQKNFNPRPRW